jgi:tetratricopeptide (TPR) repeat protein
LDRRETDFKTSELVVRDDDHPGVPPKSFELLRQGDSLYSRGLYHQAIHVWTRILFLDRGNPEVRLRIDKAKEAVAERERRLDAEIAEARRLFDGGEIEGARERVRSVLAADAGHGDAVQLAASIDAVERRNEPPRGASAEIEPTTEAKADPAVGASLPPASTQGVVIRVPKSSRLPAGRGESPATSRVKMAAFLLGALLLFAVSAFYLSENWEALVSDGAFGNPAGLSPAALPDRLAPNVPDLSQLRYYNGERLFAQGRYREALAELRRVDRDSAVVTHARSLILRIEDRLLRSASGPEPGNDAR